MKVPAAHKSAPLRRGMLMGSQKNPVQPVDENRLPNLLDSCREDHPWRTSHSNRKFAASKSEGALISSPSFDNSKCLGGRDSNLFQELGVSSSDHAVGSDQCHKTFPLKAVPLKRWRAAATIQSYLSKWRKGKGQAMPNPKVHEVSEPLSQASLLRWPEEPNALTPEDLEALTELESTLLEHHGTLSAAYKFIINCVRNAGSYEPDITKREFRIALHLKSSQEARIQNTPGWDRDEHMFDKLLRLLRKHDGDISKAEFLRFPELLIREKSLQELATDANRELLLGTRLWQRFVGPIETAQGALELFQKSVVALQLEPSRTTNILFGIASAAANPSGLTLTISNIMRIAHQFGGSKHGVGLDVLLAGWNLCSALAKRVINLGAPFSTKKHIQPAKLSKGKVLGKLGGGKYHRKVEDSMESNDVDNETHEHEWHVAFWQALQIGEVLWNVGCGAEVLNDGDFKSLLHAAWGLFDDFDAIVYHLGPVGWGRMRPKLDALVALNLEQHLFGKDRERARTQLQNTGILLRQIASMCQADPRLARIAALFGVSFLADRMRSTANASVNFADGAFSSAAAQVNRSAAAVNEELRFHVEELLEGRKVQCCITSGHFRIVRKKSSDVEKTEMHRVITAEVLAKATVKGDLVRPSSAQTQKRKGDRLMTPIGNSRLDARVDRIRPSSASSIHKRVRPSSATGLRRGKEVFAETLEKPMQKTRWREKSMQKTGWSQHF